MTWILTSCHKETIWSRIDLNTDFMPQKDNLESNWLEYWLLATKVQSSIFISCLDRNNSWIYLQALSLLCVIKSTNSADFPFNNYSLYIYSKCADLLCSDSVTRLGTPYNMYFHWIYIKKSLLDRDVNKLINTTKNKRLKLKPMSPMFPEFEVLNSKLYKNSL